MTDWFTLRKFIERKRNQAKNYWSKNFKGWISPPWCHFCGHALQRRAALQHISSDHDKLLSLKLFSHFCAYNDTEAWYKASESTIARRNRSVVKLNERMRPDGDKISWDGNQWKFTNVLRVPYLIAYQYSLHKEVFPIVVFFTLVDVAAILNVSSHVRAAFCWLEQRWISIFATMTVSLDCERVICIPRSPWVIM